MKARNIIISADGENTLVCCLTLTIDEITKYAKICGLDVEDVFEVRPEYLQYHCIDGRVWIDTENKEASVRRTNNRVPWFLGNNFTE